MSFPSGFTFSNTAQVFQTEYNIKATNVDIEASEIRCKDIESGEKISLKAKTIETGNTTGSSISHSAIDPDTPPHILAFLKSNKLK